MICLEGFLENFVILYNVTGNVQNTIDYATWLYFLKSLLIYGSIYEA